MKSTLVLRKRNAISCGKIYNHVTHPAPDNPYRRVRAREHQRDELVALSKDYLVQERAVEDERDAHGDVEGTEAVEQEESRLVRRRCETIECQQEQDQPKDGVDSLDRKLGRGKEEGEE